jgi:aspartate-semialdehyde dehydrogenase
MVRVGILGATGAVGQRLIQLLEPHDDFEIAALTASESSAGKTYREAAKWRVDAPIPESVTEMEVTATDPSEVSSEVDLLFSSLPSSVGAEVEPAFVEAGYVVSSNSSNARMDADVPLVIPEVNADHLELLEVSTITFVPTLAPLVDWGLETVHVATLQAVSGAGYDGVTSMEIIDNALPHIGGEAEKLETESRKLLGGFDGAEIDRNAMSVSASCNRIPTLDGHLENVWVETAEDLSPAEAADAMRAYPSLDLPSSPEPLIHVFEEPDRPQPRLDRTLGGGMAVAAGGLETTPSGLQYNCLSHNTIRGAAGASVLNGELLLERGYV